MENYTKFRLKPPEEVLQALAGTDDVFVMARNKCFQEIGSEDRDDCAAFVSLAESEGKPVQLGVIIPKGAAMCRYMNNNVAGVHVPDDRIAELAADKDRAKAGVTCVEIAARLIRACRPYCQGVHIMALGWESKVPALLEQAGI